MAKPDLLDVWGSLACQPIRFLCYMLSFSAQSMWPCCGLFFLCCSCRAWPVGGILAFIIADLPLARLHPFPGHFLWCWIGIYLSLDSLLQLVRPSSWEQKELKLHSCILHCPASKHNIMLCSGRDVSCDGFSRPSMPFSVLDFIVTLFSPMSWVPSIYPHVPLTCVVGN